MRVTGGTQLPQQGGWYGSKHIFKKKKIISNLSKQKEIKIEGETIEIMDSVIYLGQTISFQNEMDKEINGDSDCMEQILEFKIHLCMRI